MMLNMKKFTMIILNMKNFTMMLNMKNAAMNLMTMVSTNDGDGKYEEDGFANHLFSINCPDVVHLLQAGAVCGRKSLQK